MRRVFSREWACASAVLACFVALAIPNTASAVTLDSGTALGETPTVELSGKLRKPSRFRMEWVGDPGAVLAPGSSYTLKCRKNGKTRTHSNDLFATATMISALFESTDSCEISATFILDRPGGLEAKLKAKRQHS